MTSVAGLRLFFAALAGGAMVWPGACAAQSTPDWNATTLSGDWGGARTALSRRGVTVDVGYTADVFGNAAGGLARGATYMDRLDIILSANMGTLADWQGNTVLVHVLSNHGGKLNANRVGSFMGVDNIEASTNTTRLYQAWMEQRLFDGKLSVLAGIYAVDSEFNVDEASEIFTHPSFGTSPELAQSGINGPSIFPTTAVGLRLKLQPTRGVYVQAALLDGVPGDPNNPYGTHVQFNRGDGTLMIAEAGLRPAQIEAALAPKRVRHGDPKSAEQGPEPRLRPISKIAIGYWRYTPRFDDISAVDAAGNPLRRQSNGAYVLAEETLYQERDDAERGLAAFISYGVANGDVNSVDYAAIAGLYYKGLIRSRPLDELGLGVTRAHAGAKFRQASAAAGMPVGDAEVAIELTYRMQAKPWLTVQPMVQRIIRPGFGVTSSNAWVAGLRIKLAL